MNYKNKLLLLAGLFGSVGATIDDDFVSAARDGNVGTLQSRIKQVKTRTINIALIQACDNGQTNAARYLIVKEADIRTDNFAALRAALTNNHAETLENLLLSEKISKDQLLINEVILWAAENDLAFFIDFFIKNGLSDQPTLENALILASSAGHADIANMLLGQVGKECASLGEALKRALMGNHRSVIDVFINHGLSSRALNRLLVAASSKGFYETTQTLIEHGADVNTENGQALEKAAVEKHYEIVKLLLERGFDLRSDNCRILQAIADNKITDPCIKKLLCERAAHDAELVQHIATQGYGKILALLETYGANLVSADGALLVKVHENCRGIIQAVADKNFVQAVQQKDAELVEQLLHGNIVTPSIIQEQFDRAIEQNNNVILSLLAQKVTKEQINKALLDAIQHKNIERAKALIRGGADVNCQERAPLFLAIEKQSPSLVLLLLCNGADCTIHRPDPVFSDVTQKYEIKLSVKSDPVFFAVIQKNTDILEIMLDHNSRELQEAAQSGDFKKVEALIHTTGTNTVGIKRAFCLAARYEHIAIMNLLQSRVTDEDTLIIALTTSAHNHKQAYRLVRQLCLKSGIKHPRLPVPIAGTISENDLLLQAVYSDSIEPIISLLEQGVIINYENADKLFEGLVSLNINDESINRLIGDQIAYDTELLTQAAIQGYYGVFDYLFDRYADSLLDKKRLLDISIEAGNDRITDRIREKIKST